MKTTVEERLNLLCHNKTIGKSELADLIGITRQSIQGWIKNNSIGKASALKIIEKFPDINLKWLLGEDDRMFLNAYKIEEMITIAGEPCLECMRKQGIIDSLKEMIKEKEQRIEELLTHKDCGNNKKAC